MKGHFEFKELKWITYYTGVDLFYLVFKDKVTSNYLEIFWNCYVIGVIHILMFSAKIKVMVDTLQLYLGDDTDIFQPFPVSDDEDKRKQGKES